VVALSVAGEDNQSEVALGDEQQLKLGLPNKIWSITITKAITVFFSFSAQITNHAQE